MTITNASVFFASPLLTRVSASRFPLRHLVVYVTGHSLGGSLATLNALFLKLQMPSINIKNRAFAPPRVGNSAFAAFYPSIVSQAPTQSIQG